MKKLNNNKSTDPKFIDFKNKEEIFSEQVIDLLELIKNENGELKSIIFYSYLNSIITDYGWNNFYVQIHDDIEDIITYNDLRLFLIKLGCFK